MDKKCKKAKQVRVFIASIVLASVIVVGGTFAWFTSKDEVTNKLTATNSYGVTIEEDFTPPSNWTPGQNVTKKVSVVNTGNIDAFANVQLSNYINVTTKSADTAIADINTKKDTLVELSTDEAKSAQAGGRLVYKAGSAVNDSVSSEGYTPTTTGLYIFERNITPTTTGNPTTTYTYEYSGYYYDNGKYYEISIPNNIVTRNANGDVTAVDVTGIKLTSTTTVENKTPELDYTNITATDNPYVKATYHQDTGTTIDHTNDIIVDIYLSETFTQQGSTGIYTSTDWTFNSTTETFYYNHILMAGDTSKNLVTSIELDDTVQKEAYTALDYNLKITSNSVQVVYSSDGSIVETGITPDTTSLEALETWKDTYKVDTSSTTLKSDGSSGYDIVWSFVTT